MLNFVKSEWLKQKHTFQPNFVWLAPLLTLLMGVFLMGGANLQNGAYNWWYTILLPGSFTMFTAFMTAREKQKNRHGLFGIAVQKGRLWQAQIILGTMYLFATCMLFFAGAALGGFVFEQTVPVAAGLVGSLVLFVTFAWQIPLWMFVTEKLGTFAAVFLSFACNLGVGVFFATEKLWWNPFSIPARLMTPIIGVLPNGLWAKAGSELTNKGVIVPGLLISITLFLLATVVTTRWFQKKEV
ncbi:lantibiotic immunity ABC transporter MutE/EpiE family permease subunit [Clostridium merdae]|uniref:lantibiotic immunity ABC transporter MutE/EpiE family permease subunit n=1 Tax=Clostridium merdae TaxID=1958780 RepID=UPI000A2671DD|nr:lantibiotic immunity ABC transporter MutE/EpiE family permease subunit [Clostridium merdae]